jgi:hypothetical protein
LSYNTALFLSSRAKGCGDLEDRERGIIISTRDHTTGVDCFFFPKNPKKLHFICFSKE